MCRTLLICVAACLLSLGVIHPASADIPHETELIYYDVEAKNLNALRVNIFKVTPNRENGKTFAGFTENRWNWNIKWQERGNACHITDVKIDVKTTITMPRWTSARRAKSKEYAEWRRYSKALLAHEREHESIGLETAAQIKRALEDLRPARTCQRLFSNAKRVARDIETDGQARQDAFDARTDHGASQGAQLK